LARRDAKLKGYPLEYPEAGFKLELSEAASHEANSFSRDAVCSRKTRVIRTSFKVRHPCCLISQYFVHSRAIFPAEWLLACNWSRPMLSTPKAQ